MRAARVEAAVSVGCGGRSLGLELDLEGGGDGAVLIQL